MYDVKALEKQWKQYNRNKKKPYYFALVVIVLLIGIVSFYSYKKDILPTLPHFHSSVAISPYNQSSKRSVLLDGAITTIQEKEIVENIKPEVQVVLEKQVKENFPTLPVVDDIPVLDEKPKPKRVKKPKITVAAKQSIAKPRKKMHLNIVESSSVSAYKDVARRFYESHDTDDSLFLAKSYFRKGNYKKSEYWALQTNKVNSNIEESWIIFAKSKVKLGRKNEAIRILTNYVKRSNSQAASHLLQTLQKN